MRAAASLRILGTTCMRIFPTASPDSLRRESSGFSPDTPSCPRLPHETPLLRRSPGSPLPPAARGCRRPLQAPLPLLRCQPSPPGPFSTAGPFCAADQRARSPWRSSTPRTAAHRPPTARICVGVLRIAPASPQAGAPPLPFFLPVPGAPVAMEARHCLGLAMRGRAAGRAGGRR